MSKLRANAALILLITYTNQTEDRQLTDLLLAASGNPDFDLPFEVHSPLETTELEFRPL
ncbi:hypothetical protein [Granulicella aggregans]|uniref:hypothetical protein n=1 Tax=Granulicella aggregans TaxID=474949 RepID=UPI0021E008D2|nr:hypothetical protein [Granulicella aggregans]